MRRYHHQQTVRLEYRSSRDAKLESQLTQRWLRYDLYCNV